MWFNKLILTVVLIFYLTEVNSASDLNTRKSRLLSRRRRYVTFPEGSSFSCAGCMTVGVIGQPAPITSPGLFTFGLNWGIAYELPNETQTLNAYKHFGKHSKPALQRRNRRDLYEKLETIINSMGYSGRSCVLKTLCETAQRFVPHGPNMIHEMFRTLFTFPIAKMLPLEPVEHSVYADAQKISSILEDCDLKYKDCPLSLIDLVQGYYNAQAPDQNIPFKPFSLLSNFG